MAYKKSYLQEVLAYGFTKPLNEERWSIVCGTCDTRSDRQWPSHMPPDMMVRNMRRIGWEIAWKKPAVCPACLNPNHVAETETPMTGTVVPSGGPDPKIARRIFALLDTHFDENRKRYKGDYTDAKIAKEAETSITLVERIRRDAYGELAEPPEVAKLRDDINALLDEISATETRMLEVLTSQVGQLREKQAKLADRLAHLTHHKAAG